MSRWVSAVIAVALVFTVPVPIAQAGPPAVKPGKGKVTVILRIEDGDYLSLTQLEAAMQANPDVPDYIKADPASLKSAAEDQQDIANAHSVTLASHDPQTPKKVKYRTISGTSIVDNTTTGARWMVGQIDAGNIHIQRFSLQSLWHLCYDKETVMTEAKAGEVILLGTFDTRLNRGIIEDMTRSGRLPRRIDSAQQIAGDGMVFGQSLQGFDPVEDDAQLAQANTFARVYAPGIQVRAATVRRSGFDLPRVGVVTDRKGC